MVNEFEYIWFGWKCILNRSWFRNKYLGIYNKFMTFKKFFDIYLKRYFFINEKFDISEKNVFVL